MALPPELVYGIMSWCTPAELVNFSLANKIYKYDAEKYLYRNIKLSETTEKCLVVLSQNPDKALLVWSFSLFLSAGNSLTKAENDMLCGTLLMMKNLRHLSLCIREDQSELCPILYHNNCQLTTMCIPRFLQGGFRMLSQPTLRSLAFYGGPDEISMGELTCYEELAKSSRNQLLIYHVTQSQLDTLGVFPVFYRMSGVVGELKSLVSNVTEFVHIDTCHMFLNDLSDGSVMYDAFFSIAANFPAIKYLVILVRSLDVHIGCEGMSRFLKMLPHLSVLKIRFWHSHQEKTF